MKKANKLRVGILPGLADLYTRLFNQEVLDELKRFIASLPKVIDSKRIDFEIGRLSSTQEQMKAEAAQLAAQGVDLIVIVLSPYCPSGAVVPAVMESRIPILLWPAQTMYELIPESLTASQVRLSHGVHAVQDIANVLRKQGKKFGILHGHFREEGFCHEFEEWAQAARIYMAFASSNPIQIGGYFEDMLDLQIADASFISACGIKMTAYGLPEMEAGLKKVNNLHRKQLAAQYRDEFEVASDVTDEMLETTACGELAVRALMEKSHACACGINFLTLCNEHSIGDAMHVAASRLMAEGYGYAGEGDWVTAAFVYAMQSSLGRASFSEIFSVDYKNARLFLKHWGEGNPAMAAGKAKILKSVFKDHNKATFCVIDMQFFPGPATLVNLNADPQGMGQLLSLSGHISDDTIVNSLGPRTFFKPDCSDIRKVLDNYAYSGGSHHLTLVNGCIQDLLEKLSTLTGWSYKAL
jgi:L-arabinose isomerase